MLEFYISQSKDPQAVQPHLQNLSLQNGNGSGWGFAYRDANTSITLCAGNSDMKARTPCSTSDHYAWGSTTKVMTSVLILRLVEQGKIDPSETTVAYITGNGLKTTEAVASAVGEPLTIDPQLADFNAAWERAQSLQRATWDTVGV